MRRPHLNSTECPDTFADRIEGHRGLIASVAAFALFAALTGSYILGDPATPSLPSKGTLASETRNAAINPSQAWRAGREADAPLDAIRSRQAGEVVSEAAAAAIVKPVVAEHPTDTGNH
jgi:hypothetical protein